MSGLKRFALEGGFGLEGPIKIVFHGVIDRRETFALCERNWCGGNLDFLRNRGVTLLFDELRFFLRGCCTSGWVCEA